MLLLGQPTALVMVSWPALLIRVGSMGLSAAELMRTRRSWDQPWDPELELLCDRSAQQLLGRGRRAVNCLSSLLVTDRPAESPLGECPSPG